MPTFEFTSPQGKKYRVTAPEGATREQAWDMLQGQLGEQGVADEATPRAQQLGRGIYRGLAKAATSAVDLVPSLPPIGDPKKGALAGVRQTVREFGDAPDEGAFESVGRAVGGALPTIGLGVGPRVAATVAPIFGRLAPTIGEVAAGAGAGALQGDPVGGAEAGAIGVAMSRLAGKLGVPLGWLAQKVASHGTTAAAVSALSGFSPHSLFIWGLLHGNPVSALAGKVAKGVVRAPFEVAKRTPASVVGAGAAQNFGGGDGGQTGDAGPAQDQRTPIQSDFEALGSAGGQGQPGGDNNSAADQRFDRRWADPNYFR